jgi:lysophospholipase L1-like esterase
VRENCSYWNEWHFFQFFRHIFNVDFYQLAHNLTKQLMNSFLRLFHTLVLLFFFSIATMCAQETAAPADSAPIPTLHPALFLIGDSIMKTGTPPGDDGPYGMGYEIAPLFDPAKIHVYNEGAGGRSSRSYIGEGLWAKNLARMQPGDFVIIMFGHNDANNSDSHPDRATINAGGDESVVVGTGAKAVTIHTYGWYLRQYVKDAQAKGATVILCSPVPRNTWVDGKIKRGFNGYAQWAAEAARAGGAFFIDLNSLAADHYDALGKEQAAQCFADNQHTTRAGAKINAQSVVEGLKQLKDCPLANDLALAAP